MDHGSVEKHSDMVKTSDVNAEKSPGPVKTSNGDTGNSIDAAKTCVVTYSDEGEENDQ